MYAKRLATFVLLAVTLTAATTWADSLTIKPGKDPQPGTQPLIFDQAGLLNSGMEVQATTQGSSGLVLDYWGAQPLMTTPDGVGRMTSAAFDFNSLTIKPNQPGASFTSYSFDVNTVDGASGTLTITVDLLNGSPVTEAVGIDSGDNFFTILAGAGQQIIGINLASTVGLKDIGQERVGGLLQPSSVPEPASLMLFGSGLVGLITRFRQRRQQS